MTRPATLATRSLGLAESAIMGVVGTAPADSVAATNSDTPRCRGRSFAAPALASPAGEG